MTIVEQNFTLLYFSIFRKLVCAKNDVIHRRANVNIVLNDEQVEETTVFREARFALRIRKSNNYSE